MKKVLFLTPLPPPHYGSAMSSLMCLEILKKSKEFDVHNIKLNYSKEMDDIGKINFAKIRGIWKVKKGIKIYLRNNKPDIVYLVPATSSFGLIRDYMFVKEVRKHWDGKILFHVRSRVLERYKTSLFWKRILGKMFSGEKAIVLDDRLKVDVSDWISDKDIFVLPNAIENKVEDDAFEEIIRARRGRDSLNLLFLSNMDKSKGWEKVLDACKLLKDKNVKFICNFVGAWKDSGDEKSFNDFVMDHNLEKNVKHLGAKTGKEKDDILRSSDVLIFPTEYRLETFGRVVIEGMMFGLPVIANGIAAIPTTIQHGKTGFILKDNSSEEIADYVIKLKNVGTRERMGRLARKRFLEKYELGKYDKKFVKILGRG